MTRQVLFLCTGSSCRSHLAEAIVNARLSDEWHAVSAGMQPMAVFRTVRDDMLEKTPDLLRRYSAL